MIEKYYDPTQGVQWLLKSAENGCEYAYYVLGQLYFEGEHIPKDLQKALSYLKEAANRNVRAAQIMLQNYRFMKKSSICCASHQTGADYTIRLPDGNIFGIYASGGIAVPFSL